MGFTVEHYQENAQTPRLREHRVTVRATGHDRLAYLLSNALAIYIGMVSALDESLVSPDFYSRGDFMRGERQRRVQQIALQEITHRCGGTYAALDDIVVEWDKNGIYATYVENGSEVIDSE